MEESKAAAYYDELTRKGERAARFKQGLGFTSNDDNNANAPIKGSALPSSSSSFLNSFVKASTPNTDSEIQHQSELYNIKNKLKKKSNSESNQPRVSDRDNKNSNSRDRDRNKERHSIRRSRSRSRSRDRGSRHVNRSSSRDRYRDRDRDRDRDGERRRRRRKRRSRSRSDSDEERERRRGRKRSRSLSPQRGGRKSERNGGGGDKDKGVEKGGKEKNGKVDYSRLIDGYDKMTPAERVKAKMKLQLSETVEKDTINGMGSGWERFEFNKDAPLDDEEVEAVEDDAALVKHIGQSFRFSAVEARNEEQIKSAHDNAMFGVPALSTSVTKDNELEEDNKSENHKSDVTSLVSEKVCNRENERADMRKLLRKLLLRLCRYLQSNKVLGVIGFVKYRMLKRIN